MNRTALIALGLVVALVAVPGAQAKVVNEYTEPHPACDGRISEDIEITVRGGRKFATEFNGAVFTFDERQFEFPACSRVHVTFINTDDIRHQFMVHGTFPNGFFMLEVDGPGQANGTFVVGEDPKTMMVHCGLPQHQQKGMKAQVQVNGGEGDIPNILGISGVPPQDEARVDRQASGGMLDMATLPLDPATVLMALAVAVALTGQIRRRDED